MTDGLVLLRPSPPLTSLPRVGSIVSPADMPDLHDELLVVDIETRGTNATAQEFRIVGIGLAWGGGSSCYVEVETDADVVAVARMLARNRCVAHNVMFDGAGIEGVARRAGVTDLPWFWDTCTFGLYRQLATEGHSGQRWGLKDAMTGLLGWPTPNQARLDGWLSAAGHVKQSGKPDYGEMWRAPAEVLGHYCMLDCMATLQLYHLLMDAASQFPALVEYHQRDYLTEVRLLVHSFLDGVAVDLPRLQAYLDSLDYEIDRSRQEFFDHPQVARSVAQHNQVALNTLRDKEPGRYVKSGRESKNWLRWNERYQAATTTNHFNINSNKQLQWLFYEQLGNPVKLRTESGQPAVNTKALGLLGEPGKLLRTYNNYNKEQGYVSKACGVAESTGGTLHLQLKLPGTLTGRGAGAGGINIQQIPKSQGYMECWVARPGCVWVHSDIDALEQVVLAELSEDPTLMKLYGPGQPAQDVYLFNGAHLPVIGDAIRRHYNPEHPTAAGIDAAKAACYRERSIAKVITLASSYGAGVGKILETLQLSGVAVTHPEVQEIYWAYWRLYQGVKSYGQRLQTEWSDRGGWVYSGLGRPLCVAPHLTKDLLNRVIQTTGHDVLGILLYHLDRLLAERGLAVTWVVPDWHDEFILECAEDIAADVAEAVGDAYVALNDELAGTIPISGGVDVVNNLWLAKSA